MAPVLRSVPSALLRRGSAKLRASHGASSHTSPVANSSASFLQAGPIGIGIVEVLEELAVRRQQHAGLAFAALHAGLVGLHRAVEGEEIRIAIVRFGEDAVAL